MNGRTDFILMLMATAFIELRAITSTTKLPLPRNSREAFVSIATDRIETSVLVSIEEYIDTCDILPDREESILNEAIKSMLVTLSTLDHSNPTILEVILRALTPAFNTIADNYLEHL